MRLAFVVTNNNIIVVNNENLKIKIVRCDAHIHVYYIHVYNID